jgi:glycosyltransferase involved in cell wall biosynthesis
MLLSIIIPIYNAENFINKILDSILIRNFKDYEIILINDGSNDKSKDI